MEEHFAPSSTQAVNQTVRVLGLFRFAGALKVLQVS